MFEHTVGLWINLGLEESFEDYRGCWTKKYFSSAEERKRLKVEYLKKLKPSLH